MAPDLTAKGEATRRRIVETAADLVAHGGAANTSLDDVGRATRTSRSQLFHYFPDGRVGLMRAVAEYQAERTIADQMPYLAQLDSWDAWDAWREQLVGATAREAIVGGCRVGSLVAQLGHVDEEARQIIASAFERWRAYLAVGIRSLQARALLDPAADADSLAMGTLATIQGGLLLSQSLGTSAPLEAAVDQAIVHLRSLAPARARRTR